jgi:MFS family permease
MYSDRIGSLKTITVAALLAGLSVLLIWLPTSDDHSLRVGGLIIFTIFFGFTSGAFVSLMTPALIEVAGGHTHDLGVMVGTFFAIVAVASLTGLPIQGAIIQGGTGISGSGLTGLIFFCGVTMLAGSALLAVSTCLREAAKKKTAEKS